MRYLVFALLIVGFTLQWLDRQSFVQRRVEADALPERGRYAYAGTRFRELVEESYRLTRGTGSADEFFRSVDRAAASGSPLVPGSPMVSMDEALSLEYARLGSMSGQARLAEEIRVLEWSHAFVKRFIPRFSLDRGFEFRAAVESGERQCLLQSVVIASLLQRMGVTAGIVMVSRNHQGKESNNGHVAVLAHLSDGTARLVDASEKTPFATQQALMVSSGGYLYVEPSWSGNVIRAFRRQSDGRDLPPSAVLPLDYQFVRSQFHYYRGERAAGGFFQGPRTPEGLETMARRLERSVAACPDNPLPIFLLGRVREEQGRVDEAARWLGSARGLYERYGWVPQNLLDAQARLASQ